MWSSAWSCAHHGSVAPYTVLTRPGIDALEHVRTRARVPVWLPHGLGVGWLVSGFGCAGDERDGARATATAMTGPSPLGGAADLVLVAEEPGVGLGARLAGLPGPDPGAGFDAGPPDAKLEACGHPTALWSIASDNDTAAFVGEAKGLWLWALVFPASAGLLMYDNLSVVDLRDGYQEAEIVFGSLSPRLSAVPVVR